MSIWPAAFSTVFGAESERGKRVLIISTGSRFGPGFALAEQTFLDELRQLGKGEISFYGESLDIVRFPRESHQRIFGNYLSEKYADSSPDIVVLIYIGNLAVAQQFLHKLFPTVPIVVIGFTEEEIPAGGFGSHVSGIVQRVDSAKTIELILNLRPEIRRIIVIGGTADVDRDVVSRTRESARQFSQRVEFDFWTEMAMSELLAAAKSLPPQTAILFTRMFRDGKGQSFNTGQAGQMIAAVTNAPVFITTDSSFGTGAVGGSMGDVSSMARSGAQIAHRALRGSGRNASGLEIYSQGVPTFDWRALRRWGISETRLPAGSIVRFRETSFWREYAWSIILVALICVIEGVLIDILLRERRRRRLAQHSLEERLGFEKLVSELSGTFINLPAGKIEAQIVAALNQVASFLRFDIGALSLFTGRGTAARVAYLWRAEGVPEIPSDLTDEDFPWVAQELLAGRDVCIRSLEMLPSSARTDRATYEKYHVRSVYNVRMITGEEVIGVFSLCTAWEERDMSQELLQSQRLLGEIFANALARKKAQEALQESEQNFRRLVETTAAVPWEADMETWGFTYVGPQAVKLLGYPIERWYEKDFWTSHLHPDDKEFAINTRLNLSRSGENFEFQYRMGDSSGKVVWVHEVVRCENQNGKAAQLRGLMLDVSKRKAAEEALWESEERFRTLANTAPVLIWVSDTDKRATFFNKSWLDFTGRTLEEELGNGWVQGLHYEDCDRLLETYKNAFDARQEFTTEYRLRRLDGEYRWVLATGVPRIASNGNFLGYIGCASDITERKHAELETIQQRAELAHIARLSTMGELAASLAHELNQPLTAILSNAQAAQRFLASNSASIEEIGEILNDIVDDDKRAAEVIRRMRALVKKEQIDFAPVDLKALIDDVVLLTHSDATLHNISVVMGIDSTLPPVWGDKVQLQQVMLNLLLNAFDAMKDGSPTGHTVSVKAGADGAETVRVSVRDCGSGLTGDQIEKIFQPFYTTKSGGLGMGLSISRSIIQAHGGRLWAGNNSDRGATFYFTVPVSKAEAS